MKKIILLILTLMFIETINAQVYPKTVGLRTSVGNYGIGPELSYQHGMGDNNRIELGIGISFDNNFDRFGIMGAYHWVNKIESGFSWFAGPAIQGGIYSINNRNNNAFISTNLTRIGVAIGGQAGVEYDFNETLDLPFTASIDAKPMFNIVEYYSGFEFAVGLSIRYTF